MPADAADLHQHCFPLFVAPWAEVQKIFEINLEACFFGESNRGTPFFSPNLMA
jgi:hypothetical protein